MVKFVIVSILILMLILFIAVEQIVNTRRKNIKTFKCKYLYALYLEHQLSNDTLTAKERKQYELELEILKTKLATYKDIMELKYNIGLLRNQVIDELNEHPGSEREKILRETRDELLSKFCTMRLILADWYHVDAVRKSIRISDILDIHQYLEDKKKLLREE